jgi:homospermidine synthase
MILASFCGRLILVGFGCVGRGVLPLILRHIAIDPAKITIVTPDDIGSETVLHYGVRVIVASVTPANYRQFLHQLLMPGDFMINCGLHVSSVAMIDTCREVGALYLDTSIEPWLGVFRNSELPMLSRTNHTLRRSLRARGKKRGGPTALVAHGANPGLVSHFVKLALLQLAADSLGRHAIPKCRAEWAALGRTLGIRTIHVTERDSQTSGEKKCHGEFVNTWSPGSLIDELCQPLGTHQK